MNVAMIEKRLRTRRVKRFEKSFLWLDSEPKIDEKTGKRGHCELRESVVFVFWEYRKGRKDNVFQAEFPVFSHPLGGDYTFFRYSTVWSPSPENTRAAMGGAR